MYILPYGETINDMDYPNSFHLRFIFNPSDFLKDQSYLFRLKWKRR